MITTTLKSTTILETILKSTKLSQLQQEILKLITEESLNSIVQSYFVVRDSGKDSDKDYYIYFPSSGITATIFNKNKDLDYFEAQNITKMIANLFVELAVSEYEIAFNSFEKSIFYEDRIEKIFFDSSVKK